MLSLTINKKWFGKVVSGDQKEVYLTAIPFNEEKVTSAWGRDMSSWKNPQEVCLETEEGKKCRAMCTLAMGEGYPDWGAERGVLYYIIRIQKTLDVPTEDAAENIEEVAKVIEEVKVVTEEATQALEKAAEDLEEASKVIEEANKVIEETSKLVEEESVEEEPIAEEEEEVMPKFCEALNDGKVLVHEKTIDGVPVGLICDADKLEEEPAEEVKAESPYNCNGKCGFCTLKECPGDDWVPVVEEDKKEKVSDSTPIAPVKKDVK